MSEDDPEPVEEPGAADASAAEAEEADEGRLSGLPTIPPSLVSLLFLALGVVLGSFFPDQLLFIGEAVQGAFGFLGEFAPYLIFITLTPALGGMMRTGSAARFAGAVSVGMVVSTFSAGFFGILVAVPILNLPVGAAKGGVLGIIAEIVNRTGEDVLTSDPFIAIYGAIIVSVGLFLLERYDSTEWFAEPTARVLRQVGVDGVEYVGEWVKRLLPAILLALGIFIPTSASNAVAEARNQLGDATVYQVWGSTDPVVWYFFAVSLVGITGLVWVLGVAALICRYTGFSYREFLDEYFLYVYPFSWATASSAVSIPLNLEQADEGLGVREEIREFIIPLGATVNLDGTVMAGFLLIPITTYLLGVQMTLIDLFLILIPLTVVSIGIPGVPGGLPVVASPVVLAFFPSLPEEAFIALFFALGVGLTDQFRTGVNTIDNGLMCLIFEHWYDDHFAYGGGAAAEGEAAEPSVEIPDVESEPTS
jgi:Na+/H+-dicarboxylate symporter